LVALGLVVLVLLLGVAIAKGAGMPAMVLIVVAVLAVFGGGSVLLWLSSKANGTTAATAQQDARADQPTLPTESVKQ
jgi:flagellar basal body-associated protein FliL